MAKTSYTLLNFRKKFYKWNSSLSFFLSIISFLIIVYEFGIYSTDKNRDVFEYIYFYSIIIIGGLKILRYLVLFPKKLPIEVWIFDSLFILAVALLATGKFHYYNNTYWLWKLVNNNIWLYVMISLIFFKKISGLGIGLSHKRFNPALIFVLSFLILIILGTLLLLLPNATHNGISIMNALFTSTSAVCVTGLTVVDTAKDFTLFGQTIILILIQLGGIGIMTFTSFFSFFFKGKTTFHSQLLLGQITNSENFAEIFDVFKKIIIITFLIEGIGAAIIFFNLDSSYFINNNENIFFSVFHSVSAFCGAGFTTITDGFYNINIRFNYPIHLVASFLIILGGIGFHILFNFYKYLKHFFLNRVFKWNKYREVIHQAWVINLNTRIVFITTLVLLIAGTVIIYFLEYNYSLEEHKGLGKVVTAFFASVTPRSAGLHTFNTGSLLTPTILIIILLMWIGGSPASVAGGIKTSTFALAILNVISLARGKDRVELYRRKVSDISLRRAHAIIFLSLIVIGISVLLVSSFDPDKKLLDIVFECFSAYSTVGLSLGITQQLSEPSKFIIILTMFLGRMGTLTIMMAILKKVTHLSYKYPEENILIN